MPNRGPPPIACGDGAARAQKQLTGTAKHTTTCSASTAATVERHIICPPASRRRVVVVFLHQGNLSLSLLFVSVSVLPTRHLHHHHHRSFLPLLLLLLHHLTDPLLSFHSTSCPLSFTLPRSLPAQQPVNSSTPTATTTTTTTIKPRLPAIAVPPPTIPLHLSPAHHSPPPWASSSTSARDRSCARPPRPSQLAKSHTCLSAEDAISPSA